MQAVREAFSVELRIAARLRDGSHIHQPADPMGLENPDEFFNGMRGMADGADNHLLFPSPKVAGAAAYESYARL